MNLTFKIPEGGTLIPKKGATICIGDNFIKVGQADFRIYPVATQLSIRPEAIFTHLTVVVGQAIEPQTILAEKKSMVGTKKIVSDISGIIDKINYETGDVIVRFGSSEKSNTTPAFFNGTLEEIDIKKGVFTVSIPSKHEIKLKNVSGNGGGEIVFLSEKDFFTITSDEVSGKVVFLDNPQAHVVSKLEALDTAAILSDDPIPSTILPHATLQNKSDMELFSKSKPMHIVISELESKAILYA